MRTVTLYFLFILGVLSFDSVQAPSAVAQDASPAKTQKNSVKQREVFDINTATKAELETLKGVGPAHADAIIKGRPYLRKDELVRRKIISKEVYDDIKRKIFARRPKDS